MGCRGVHFALSAADEERLLRLASDDERVEFVTEDVEERYCGSEHGCETDKAWDAIHRCFDKGHLTYAQQTPLQMAILGGKSLSERDDYIISYKFCSSIGAIAEAIRSIDEQELRRRYFGLDPKEYGLDLTDEDFEYVWHWYAKLRDFYDVAAKNRRAVIFTADQ